MLEKKLKRQNIAPLTRALTFLCNTLGSLGGKRLDLLLDQYF